jgi:hypothetical protein
MLMDCDYKILGTIDKNLIDSVKDKCLSINWKDSKFDRFEETLLEGRLCCLPYIIVRDDQKQYSDEQLQLIELLNPIINKVMESFPGYTKIRGEVATLYTGARLTLHRDISWFHTACRRIHVPIYTNSQCEQIFEDRSYHLDVGTVYEINNRIHHSAFNGGNDIRIHLILDLIETEKFDALSPFDKTWDRLIRNMPHPKNGKEVD